MTFLSIVLVGCLAGWIVGKLVRGRGFGFIGNTLIGILGSWIGSFLFALTGLAVTNTAGSIVMSVVGALVLLFLLSALKPGPRRKASKSEEDDE